MNSSVCVIKFCYESIIYCVIYDAPPLLSRLLTKAWLMLLDSWLIMIGPPPSLKFWLLNVLLTLLFWLLCSMLFWMWAALPLPPIGYFPPLGESIVFSVEVRTSLASSMKLGRSPSSNLSISLTISMMWSEYLYLSFFKAWSTSFSPSLT